MSDLISSTNENNFEELLDEQFKEVEESNESGRVVGIVDRITPSEVFVTVAGRKQAGIIPIDELSSIPISDPSEVVKVGDKLDLLIMKTNDQEGTIMLSKKRVDAKKNFEVLQNAYKNKEVLTGVVKEVVNGGIIVISNGARVFIPASQASISKDANLDDMVGQEVQFRLIEVSQRGRRTKIIGSVKSVLRDELSAAKQAFWEEVEIGKVLTGVVKTLTNYGAFVDLGGVSGMIHITELSWNRIKHPSEVVKVDDTVEVYIKDIDKESRKISLGYKKTEDNPWLILKENYPEGSVVKAKVVGLTSFGAFARIIDGIDGLIHISQISYDRIEKPADVLKIGDEVEVKITAIDFDNKKVSISIKALLPEPVKPVPEENKEVSTEDEVVASADSEGVTISDTVELEDEIPAEVKTEEKVEDTPAQEQTDEVAEEKVEDANEVASSEEATND